MSGRIGTGEPTAGSAAEQAMAHSTKPDFVSFGGVGSGQCSIGMAAAGRSCAAAGAAVIPSGISITASKASSFNAMARMPVR